jgi:hypothetical protein
VKNSLAKTATKKLVTKNFCAKRLKIHRKKMRRVFFSKKPISIVFVAAQKLVALDRSNHAHRGVVARFGTLNSTEATDADWSGQGDLVGKRQEDFDGGTFLDVLGEVKINPAGTYVARFRAGFSNGGPGSPTNGQGEPHGEALSCAAFRAGQGKTSSN